MRVAVILLTGILTASSAFGHDFIDFVTLVDSGLSARVVWEQLRPFDCAREGTDTPKEAVCWEWPDGAGFKIGYIGSDALGNRYFFGPVSGPDFPGGYWQGVWREGVPESEIIVAFPRNVETTTPEGYQHYDSSDVMQGVSFDAVNGKLYLSLTYSWSTHSGYDVTDANGGDVIEVSGFTTVTDIIQSYEPTTGAISFRVPTHPEGLLAAESFDTYIGDLGTVGDWTLAQPLACNYPHHIPVAGERVVADASVPDPSPGLGYYYVTAVNYQGERRYGRKAIGGTLTGRDPAVLPECSQ